MTYNSYSRMDGDDLIALVKEKGFTQVSEWYREAPGSQKHAKKIGVFEEVIAACGLSTERKKHKSKWETRDAVLQEVLSKGFDTIWAWGIGSAGSQESAKRNGWFDSICAEVGIVRLHTSWESYEQVRDIVVLMGFTDKVGWAHGDVNSYSAALRHGWMEAIAIECNFVQHYRSFENADDVIAAISDFKFTSRNDWAQKEAGSHAAAKRLGVVEDVCNVLGIPLEVTSHTPDRPHRVYALLIIERDRTLVGYGATANLKQRMRQHRTNAKKAGAKVIFVASSVVGEFYDSRVVERTLKLSLPPGNSKVTGFYEESTTLRHLPDVLLALGKTIPEDLIPKSGDQVPKKVSTQF